jgi:hypothetical protein
MQYQLHSLRRSRHDHAERIQLAWYPRHLRDGSSATLEVIILGALVFINEHQCAHMLLGITANMPTSYHPQTDGQTERTNGILEDWFRATILTPHTPHGNHSRTMGGVENKLSCPSVYQNDTMHTQLWMAAHLTI